MVGDDGRGDFVHGETAVGLRDIDRHEAQISRFFQQGAGYVEMLGFDLLGRRQDFVANKVGGGAGDLPLLIGEVFRGHDFVRSRAPR